MRQQRILSGGVALSWTMLSEQFIQGFASVALSPDPDLAVAALMIARLEYPRLEAGPYIDRLDDLGREALRRISGASRLPVDAPHFADPLTLAQVTALSDYLFLDERFVGNQHQYEDPRNSCLNEVLDRRTGIPITLAVVYMEVARRAGLTVEGINFPGHFLLRCRAPRRTLDDPGDLIIDAFHGGALLSEDACRRLLREHVGEGEEDDIRRMGQATKPQILVRMLLNLKRTYTRMHSFPQARDITELLLAVNPSAVSELRDRGLLAYHMNDFSAALRDLQAYLDLSPEARADKEEHEQIWEYVKALKRRVAGFN
jgi:regulator of sirC expression with transglutaminase-like and TPR domain